MNVIIGENGSGKSHLLRVAYYALTAAGADRNGPPFSANPVKSTLQRTIATKLINVMRPESLGHLVRRPTGRQRCELALEFHEWEKSKYAVEVFFDCVRELRCLHVFRLGAAETRTERKIAQFGKLGRPTRVMPDNEVPG